MTSFGRSVVSLLLAGWVVSACARSRASTAESGQGMTLSQRPDSQMSAFLSLSVATRVPRRGMLDSVWTDTVYGSGDYERSFLLADYRVLSTIIVGDTATADAAITTAADLRVDTSVPKDSFGVIGRVVIREDTVRWTLARDSVGFGRWRVVGDGVWSSSSRDSRSPAVQLFGELVNRWDTPGASVAMVYALIDSIRRARGHPVLR